MNQNKSFQYNISKIELNPAFKNGMVPDNDIALIKLHRPVEINRYTFVRPVRIALWRLKNNERETYKCKVAGWGKHRTFESIEALRSVKNRPSKLLKEVHVPILSIKDCFSYLKNSSHVSLIINKTAFNDTMICGGSFNSNEGTACLHDSGSPLVCRNKFNEEELHGITIAIHGPDIQSKPCNPATQFMVFVRISRFARWILKVVNGS